MSKLRMLANQLQLEVDTSFLYQSIAQVQTNEAVKEVLATLATIEQGHANKILAKLRELDPKCSLPAPSTHARMQLKVGKIFGYGFIVSKLTAVEQRLADNATGKKLELGATPSGFEHNHLHILQSLSGNKSLNLSGAILSKFETRHKSVGGNALRAAVLGANDGLVSNMSLVMGVAGAAAGSTSVVVAGLSGLLAGSIAMALGEWISVQSSRELSLRQIAMETEEIETSPEDEKAELTLIYQAKGMERSAAEELANRIFMDKQKALATMVSEELGVDPDELKGTAWVASFTSFFLFAIGAIIPVLPFFFLKGTTAIYGCLAASGVGLFALGAAITLFTGRSVWLSGFRQIGFGVAAAAITYSIGHLIGASVS